MTVAQPSPIDRVYTSRLSYRHSLWLGAPNFEIDEILSALLLQNPGEQATAMETRLNKEIKEFKRPARFTRKSRNKEVRSGAR